MAHGGSFGIRNINLLLSALERPKTAHYYAQQPLQAVAAYYAIGITHNHPFVDGNKRTALAACHTFLRYHGFFIDATTLEKYNIMMDLSSGKLTDAEFIEWVTQHSAPL